VSHATMSDGKLFHNRAPAVAKARSPRVAHCDWQTSSWWVSDDRRRRQPTVESLHPDRMAPCRSVSNTRPSPACTEHARELSTIARVLTANVQQQRENAQNIRNFMLRQTNCSPT